MTAGTIGEVVDYIAGQPHMRLPDTVEEAEKRLADAGPEPIEGESRRVTRLRKLRAVPYIELIALDRFIDGHTPFATKHGVMQACTRVRSRVTETAVPEFIEAQEEALFLEESIGITTVPAQPAKAIERVHAKIWHTGRSGLPRHYHRGL
ncbi:hypothetical protein [Phyllobacterium salinisoli]|uniref:hypothetical protein n=1 Tax=Phyllobacterium salinisoli TaxID=1899321 RepID=UPI00190FBE24|nr:hypothetical protein [Phyllobacterium salinisoli]